MRHSRSLLASLVLTVSLVACGLEISGKAAEDGFASRVATTPFNDRDVLYAQLMIPHSRQAVELASFALDPETGASTAVRKVAMRMKKDHESEIDVMTSLLRKWEQPLSHGPTLDPIQLQTGILTDKHVKVIYSLNGEQFDKEFLESLISHHEGSIDMARVLMTKGRNASLRALAASVEFTRQATIDDMNDLLG